MGGTLRGDPATRDWSPGAERISWGWRPTCVGDGCPQNARGSRGQALRALQGVTTGRVGGTFKEEGASLTGDETVMTRRHDPLWSHRDLPREFGTGPATASAGRGSDSGGPRTSVFLPCPRIRFCTRRNRLGNLGPLSTYAHEAFPLGCQGLSSSAALGGAFASYLHPPTHAGLPVTFRWLGSS